MKTYALTDSVYTTPNRLGIRFGYDAGKARAIATWPVLRCPVKGWHGLLAIHQDRENLSERQNLSWFPRSAVGRARTNRISEDAAA